MCTLPCVWYAGTGHLLWYHRDSEHAPDGRRLPAPVQPNQKSSAQPPPYGAGWHPPIYEKMCCTVVRICHRICQNIPASMNQDNIWKSENPLRRWMKHFVPLPPVRLCSPDTATNFSIALYDFEALPRSVIDETWKRGAWQTVCWKHLKIENLVGMKDGSPMKRHFRASFRFSKSCWDVLGEVTDTGDKCGVLRQTLPPSASPVLCHWTRRDSSQRAWGGPEELKELLITKTHDDPQAVWDSSIL